MCILYSISRAVSFTENNKMGIEEQLAKLKESKTSRAQAAKLLNVTREKFDAILEVVGLEWEKGLQTENHACIVDGVRDSYEAHADRLGISVGMLRWRLDRNQDLSEPAKIVPATQGEALLFLQHRKNGETAQKAAALVGRPYNTLKNAAKKFCPDYDEVVLKSVKVTKEDVLKFIEFRREGMTARQAAEEVGKPYNTLKGVVKKFCPNFAELVAQGDGASIKAKRVSKESLQGFDAA
jgi:lambda repressor-like predicted transcriptional regulator